MRILLGLDVPVAALGEIEIDWALIDALSGEDPALAQRIKRIALVRVLKQTVGVSGAAVEEPQPNPFAPWVRRVTATPGSHRAAFAPPQG